MEEPCRFNEVRGVVTPGRAKTDGHLVTLHQVVSRRRLLRRIEEKLEIVAEEVT